MEKKRPLLDKRFSSLTYKHAVLAFIVIIGLLISNESLYKWVKNIGWYENDIYDLSGIDLFDLPFGRGKSLSINSMAFDSKDNLWVGRKDGVIVLRPDGSSKTYTRIKSNNLAPWNVMAIAVDNLDQVWIGGEEGLQKLTPQGLWIPELGMFGKTVYALAADQQGQLWVATEDRLSRLSEGEWTHFSTDYTSLFNTTTEALAVDRQGRVWITNLFNIGFLSPEGSWEKDVLPLKFIRSLAIDEQGRVWAKADGGLNVCGEEKCSVYSRFNSGLKSSTNAMAFDNENRLWRASTTGLHFLDVARVLPAPILNGLLILRGAVNVTLLLTAYFFVVRLSDTRREKTTPEQLAIRDILKKMWPTLVLAASVGAVLILFSNGFYNLEVTVSVALVGILGGLLTMVRMISLMVSRHISKRDIVISTIVGAIFTTVCAALILFITVIVLVSSGLLAQ